MQEYSNVEVLQLDEQALKTAANKSSGALTVKKDSKEKSYSLTVKEGQTRPRRASAAQRTPRKCL